MPMRACLPQALVMEARWASGWRSREGKPSDSFLEPKARVFQTLEIKVNSREFQLENLTASLEMIGDIVGCDKNRITNSFLIRGLMLCSNFSAMGGNASCRAVLATPIHHTVAIRGQWKELV